ncbi:MAG: radical SAM protein [Methanobacterium sp.]
MHILKRELSTYFEIMLNQRLSRVKIAQKLETQKEKEMNYLWREHDQIHAEFKKIFEESISKESNSHFSYLDLKIKIAENIFKKCIFCEKKCMINRNNKKGYCNVKEPRIASEFLHMGEEAPLVPSHTIFFTGCNFECIYCQNFDISQFPGSRIKISEEKLAKIIDRRRMEGSRNVNFVGGDPTPNLLYILKTMQLVEENVPVIWNSNFYMSEDTMKLLQDFVELYLSDFKYGPSDCGEKLSGIDNYCEIITRNHLMAKKAGDMIIRHLVLPGHVECCSKPILKWISENLGNETVVNIMGQYRPVYRANECMEIMKYPSREEMEEVVNYAKRIGLINLI